MILWTKSTRVPTWISHYLRKPVANTDVSTTANGNAKEFAKRAENASSKSVVCLLCQRFAFLQSGKNTARIFAYNFKSAFSSSLLLPWSKLRVYTCKKWLVAATRLVISFRKYKEVARSFSAQRKRKLWRFWRTRTDKKAINSHTSIYQAACLYGRFDCMHSQHVLFVWCSRHEVEDETRKPKLTLKHFMRPLVTFVAK